MEVTVEARANETATAVIAVGDGVTIIDPVGSLLLEEAITGNQTRTRTKVPLGDATTTMAASLVAVAVRGRLTMQGTTQGTATGVRVLGDDISPTQTWICHAATAVRFPTYNFSCYTRSSETS